MDVWPSRFHSAARDAQAAQRGIIDHCLATSGKSSLVPLVYSSFIECYVPGDCLLAAQECLLHVWLGVTEAACTKKPCSLASPTCPRQLCQRFLSDQRCAHNGICYIKL